MKKLKIFVGNHKQAILDCFIALLVCITLVTGLWAYTMTIIADDLRNVVEMQNTEIDELKRSNIFLKQKAEDIEQTYEESVPKLEYTTKIQYYESVIGELITQCEKECKKCGN